mgnify:CR=1 FL=1
MSLLDLHPTFAPKKQQKTRITSLTVGKSSLRILLLLVVNGKLHNRVLALINACRSVQFDEFQEGETGYTLLARNKNADKIEDISLFLLQFLNP